MPLQLKLIESALMNLNEVVIFAILSDFSNASMEFSGIKRTEKRSCSKMATSSVLLADAAYGNFSGGTKWTWIPPLNILFFLTCSY